MQISKCVSLTKNFGWTYRHCVRCFSFGTDESEKYRPAAGRKRDLKGLLKNEFKSLFSKDYMEEPEVPNATDVLIIGGGLIGASAAYWLKSRAASGLSVTLVERDFGYTHASTMLSVGGVRHQFSQPENVQMSMFTSEFLRDIKDHLSVLDQDPPDVQFHHHGYLFLSPGERTEALVDSVKMQRKQGAQTVILNKEMLAEKFPWLNLDGIEIGSYGTAGEGWFDPYQLVCALKAKHQDLGVNYVEGEVCKFRFVEKGDRKWIKGVDIRHKNGRIYGCDIAVVVNCGGAWAGQIADMAGIGTGESGNTEKLPVEPRKRYVYCFHCPDGPTLDTPLTVDPSGVYFRREGLGGHYLCGASPPTEAEEPDIGNLDVDYEFFYDYVWPTLAKRVPAFENSKLKSAWAGFYDYNTLDQNLIIGYHPFHSNFIFANGLSGHGVQQALAVGRAVHELFTYEGYRTIDLSAYHFDRVQQNRPLLENAIV